VTRAAAIAVLALAAAGPAAAHHSVAMYDRAHPVTVEAEVKSFSWVNPHSALVIVTRPKPGAAPMTWTLELSSPGVLTRAGWTKRSFTPGDRLTVDFGPLRDGGAGGFFIKATLADGKVMAYDFGETTVLK
jgi:hypothetical protein